MKKLYDEVSGDKNDYDTYVVDIYQTIMIKSVLYEKEKLLEL